MEKLCLLPTCEAQVHTGLVSVSDIMPDALMLNAAYTHDGIGDQIENPVQVVRAPVIENAAGNRLLGVPVVAGVSISSDKGFDMENRSNRAALEDLLNCQVVGVPASALIDGE